MTTDTNLTLDGDDETLAGSELASKILKTINGREILEVLMAFGLIVNAIAHETDITEEEAVSVIAEYADSVTSVMLN